MTIAAHRHLMIWLIAASLGAGAALLGHRGETASAGETPCPPFALPLYDRDAWGSWADLDGDCQDARVEILVRDSAPADLRFAPGRGCKVTLGLWVDPYDGRRYVRPGDVEIDHVVALAEAHRSGAWAWSAAERAAYYNDPDNLLAAGRSSNRRKSDHDPAGWQPDVGRCAYARQWLKVKRKYGLTLDAAEAEAVAEMVAADCPRVAAR